MSDKYNQRSEYLKEKCQQNKCYQCNIIINKVRKLLDAIQNIENTQVLDVCRSCNRPNPFGRCKRCDYLVNKFLSNKNDDRQGQQEYFDTLIVEVNNLLRGILECDNASRHKINSNTSSLDKLDSLLQELRPPYNKHRQHLYPRYDFVSVESLVQSKELLLDLLSKINSGSVNVRPSINSQHYTPSSRSCICKNVRDKKQPEIVLPEIKTSETRLTRSEAPKEIHFTPEKKSPNSGKALIHEKRQKDRKLPKAENTAKNKINELTKSPRVEKSSTDKTSKVDQSPKYKQSPDSELMLRLIKEKTILEKKREGKLLKPKKSNIHKIANIQSLPQLRKRVMKQMTTEGSETIVECESPNSERNEMIKGKYITRFDPFYKKEHSPPVAPILFNVQLDLNSTRMSISDDSMTSASKSTSLPTLAKPVRHSKAESPLSPASAKKSKSKQEMITRKPVIKYSLSNREFIDNGWTVLPTTKIMRRMHIYKMEPLHLGWFEKHKNKKIMFYDSGEKLAEIDDVGTGRWYYKNGNIALDYYDAEEVNAYQRYVVYSSGEEVLIGRKGAVSVMAAFDFLGNGVVYDHYGKERLKYNQCEGAVLDDKIGPSSRWHWHSLNEPVNLHPVFIDTHLSHPDPEIELLIEDERFVKEPNEDMLAVEFENLVKEKALKLLQKFKPFEIRMKALKINDQFSLRIIDQSHIYLMFREGKTSIKLNLGLLLKSDEIVDTEACEVGNVSTPYDRIPPRTQSLAKIQSTLGKARRIGKMRESENRQSALD